MRGWIALAAAGLATAVPTAGSAASIEDAAWLAGRWVGEGLGGQVEEVWSPASGGQMVGHFQFAKDGKPVFYEILLLDTTPGGLRLRVKHFNADFTAWEDKAEWVTFEPDTGAPGTLKFKGLTVTGSGDRMTATLKMRGKDGTVRDELFHFRRVRD